MKGLALNKDNDIVFSGGSAARTSAGVYVTQKVKSTLQMFLGESSLDSDAGIPYFTDIFVKPANINTIDSIFKTAILGVEEVNSLLSFESSFDSSTRQYSISFRADTIYGEIDVTEFNIVQGG